LIAGTFPTPLIGMPRGRTLLDDARWILVYMARELDVKAIEDYTGIKRRTIQRILSQFQKRSTANRPEITRLGAVRALTNDEVAVSRFHVYLLLF
jgi:hypothetical protein